MMAVDKYEDLAIVLAWPEQTARGDESWMSLFKKLGIVKNLNFKVGHSAIILIEKKTGKLAYFDFGRYISPRGYGRARSAVVDPRLQMENTAQIANGEIQNLLALLNELKSIEYATHGGKSLYFSIAQQLSFMKGIQYAQSVVDQGHILYGALARNNNSCSRYVAQILLASLKPKHPSRRSIYLPESFKASPMSNVVNADPDRSVYCFENGNLRKFNMSRYQSLTFQLSLLFHNIIPKKAALLPCDRQAGFMIEPVRPTSVPDHAQWLGGIGEGVWYSLSLASLNTYLITRYNSKGDVEYHEHCQAEEYLDPKKDYQFTYNCHYGYYTLKLQQKVIKLIAIDKTVTQAVKN